MKNTYFYTYKNGPAAAAACERNWGAFNSEDLNSEMSPKYGGEAWPMNDNIVTNWSYFIFI